MKEYAVEVFREHSREYDTVEFNVFARNYREAQKVARRTFHSKHHISRFDGPLTIKVRLYNDI